MDREEIVRRRDLTQEEINREIKKQCGNKKGDDLRRCSIKTLKKLKLPFMRKDQ